MNQYLPNRRSFLQRSLALLAGLTATPLLGRSNTTLIPNTPLIDSNPLLGEITIFTGDFAPRGWAICAGQILPINQNQALFSLLGTTYGGDGRTTFALPDLRGRMAVGTSANIQLGQRAGTETTILTAANLPGLAVSTNKVEIRTTGTQGSGVTDGGASGSSNTFLAKNNSGQPFNNMPPYIVTNYIIALQGIFPSRS